MGFKAIEKNYDIKHIVAVRPINGKAIYSPKGKAAEYGRYACNFYVGCSNGNTF